MLHEGTQAPEFSLQDQNDTQQTLSSYGGQYVLVYFYPKDNTPGCTKEACLIRDVYDEFEKKNVKVFGVSGDSVEKHKKFAEKHELPFTLLSDPDKEIIEKYEALKNKSMFGKTFLGIQRCSYLINPEGVIVKAYPNVDPAKHADEILQDLDAIIS
jgi:peroxiredoxin Q/BCP